MSLARLVYFSRVAADRPFWRSASEIVGASQARNTREQLSGVLLEHQGWYVQALEGLPCRLTRLFLRIATDPRHAEVQLSSFTSVAERRFGAWAMAHVVLTPDLGVLMDDLGPDRFDPRALSAERLEALLERAASAAARRAA